MNMEGKFTYQEIENYDVKKRIVLNVIRKENGGKLPEGFDDDLFCSALIKIIEYLDSNYNTTIKAQNIPDVTSFARQEEEYSVRSFIINRVFKNLKSVKYLKKDEKDPNMMGGYYPSDHEIKLYADVMGDNLKYLYNNNINKKFETDKDFENTLLEEIMIHELIHCISDNGSSVGFLKKGDSRNIAFNEGMTENLANEIAGLKDFSVTTFSFKDRQSNFVLKTQTSSAYKLETNIFNLIRVASREDMTIPYLVDTQHIMFGEDREIYGQSNAMDKIKTEFSEAKNNAEKDDLLKFQELQTMLIEDIFQNKYNKEFLDRIRKTGKAPSKEEYLAFKRDLLTIGRCIVPTLVSELKSHDEKKDFAQNYNITTSKDLSKLIQDGKIEPTPNVLKFKELLFAFENIPSDFPELREQVK